MLAQLSKKANMDSLSTNLSVPKEKLLPYRFHPEDGVSRKRFVTTSTFINFNNYEKVIAELKLRCKRHE